MTKKKSINQRKIYSFRAFINFKVIKTRKSEAKKHWFMSFFISIKSVDGLFFHATIFL